LPEERWVHIVERHPEMAGHLEDVLVAIATPEFIFKGAMMNCWRQCHLLIKNGS
jgi:hypothetical protein